MQNKKNLSTVLVVIILIGAFLVLRAAIVGQLSTNIKDADFEEDALKAAACTPPTVSNIQVSNISATGATVTWTTNQQTTSAVRLGTTSTSMTWLATMDTPAATNGVTMHSYTLSGLSAARTYYYRVRSSNGTCQKTSTTNSFSTLSTSTGNPDVTGPTTPTNLAATDITSNSLTLTWNASSDPTITGSVTSGVKGYEVYGPNSACNVNGSAGYCGNVLSSSTGTQSKAITGLSPATLYTGSTGTKAGFTVKAFDNVGNYSAGTPRLATRTMTTTTPNDLCLNIAGIQETVPAGLVRDSAGNCVTPPDTVAPSVPTGVSMTAKTSTSISIAWNASTDNVGVAGYRIYVNSESTPANASLVAGTTYTINGLSPSSIYQITVKALDAAGNSSTFSNSISITTDSNVTTDVTAPTRPTGLTATNITSTSFTLNWTASTDDTLTPAQIHYDVYGSSQACNVSGIVGYCGAVTGTTSMNITGLSAGTTYSALVGANAGFVVQAYDDSLHYSAGSNLLSVTTTSGADTTAPSAPTGVSMTSKTSTSISISWTASTDNVGVAGYRIYVNNATTPVNASLVAGTTYTINGLSPVTAYSINVKAVDAANNVSAVSNSISVTTDANITIDVTAPTRPTGLTATNITSSSFTLNWAASTDDTLTPAQIHYDVYGSSQACNVGGVVGYCGAVTGTTSMIITGLSPATTYSAPVGVNAGFVVQSYDDALHYSTGSNLLTVTTIAGADTTAPVISNVQVNPTATYATVTWTTNENSNTLVEFGSTTAYGLTASNSIMATSHSQNITGLTSGNTYNYRVKSTDAAGNTATSGNYTFVAQAGPTACANTSTTGYEKAMWVWKKNTEVVTAGSTEQNNLFSFVAANNIQRIYLYANKSTLAGSTFSSNLKTFLNTAWNTHCLKVELLDGASNWVVTDNTYLPGPTNTSARDWVAAAIAFNNSITGSNVKLAGLHMDTEPHGFVYGDYPDYTIYWSRNSSDPAYVVADPVKVSKAYLKMLDAVEAQMVGSGLAMAVDVPRWYDTSSNLVSINYDGVTKNLMQHVFDRVDELGIMDYIVGAGNIYSDALNELNYGMQLGKKVTIGVETIDLTSYGGGNGSVSFWTTSCSQMEDALDDVFALVGNNNKLPGFSRMAVHAYWNDKNGVMSGYKYLCQ
jgi:chitodextrinase